MVRKFPIALAIFRDGIIKGHLGKSYVFPTSEVMEQLHFSTATAVTGWEMTTGDSCRERQANLRLPPWGVVQSSVQEGHGVHSQD